MRFKGKFSPFTGFIKIFNPDILFQWLSAPSLGSYNAGFAFSKDLLVTNTARQPSTFSLVSGTLPSGLTLTSAGRLSGTIPDLSQAFAFTIRASFGRFHSDRTFTLTTVATPPVRASAANFNAVYNSSVPIPVYSVQDTGSSLRIDFSTAGYTLYPNNPDSSINISFRRPVTLDTIDLLGGWQNSPGTILVEYYNGSVWVNSASRSQNGPWTVFTTGNKSAQWRARVLGSSMTIIGGVVIN